MKKYCKLCILALLLVAITLQPPSSIRAEALEQYPRYDAATDGIVSAYYYIDAERGYLMGIAPGTSPEHLAKVCLPADVTAADGALSTGTVLYSETAGAQLTAIVTGDLDGDGLATGADLQLLKGAIFGESLSATAAAAADIDLDGQVTVTDYTHLKKALENGLPITAGRPAATDAKTLILLAPETSEAWEAGAAEYRVDDQAIASVDAAGNITAGTAEGSTFVYALDEDSKLLSRAMVTVLAGGVAVELAADTYTLYPGQTLTVPAFLNHPVDAVLSWSSGDAGIVSVSQDGTLTAHAVGTATVTVSLENGSDAQAAVTVMTPLDSIAIGKSLYKVKPGDSRVLDLTLTPEDTGEEIIWTSSDPAIATVTDGVVTGLDYGTVTITATGRYSGLCVSCSVKVCDVKVVAITFDDGPANRTPELLDFLAENEIHATFFLIANRIPNYADTVKRIADEGHEIGYHSYGHQNQLDLSSEAIAGYYEQSSQILYDLTGRSFTVWRAPGGRISQRVLDSIDLPHIMWSVDTRDWASKNEDSVYRQIIDNAQDGSIILLHDLYPTTVTGAKRAMAEMLAGDYEFVTVTELLSRDGTPPEPNRNYNNGY